MKLPADFLERRQIENDILLRDGKRVLLSLYASVYEAATSNFPTLKPGLHYRAEHVCGANFWLARHPVAARLAGRCFRDMVDSGLLLLEVVPGKSATARYRLP